LCISRVFTGQAIFAVSDLVPCSLRGFALTLTILEFEDLDPMDMTLAGLVFIDLALTALGFFGLTFTAFASAALPFVVLSLADLTMLLFVLGFTAPTFVAMFLILPCANMTPNMSSRYEAAPLVRQIQDGQ
jgi:hypothetical protein